MTVPLSSEIRHLREWAAGHVIGPGIDARLNTLLALAGELEEELEIMGEIAYARTRLLNELTADELAALISRGIESGWLRTRRDNVVVFPARQAAAPVQPDPPEDAL